MILFDSFGSSEAVGLGGSVSAAGMAEQTAKFAIGGFIPVGYYKDETKSAQTFRTIEDRRWSIPGDCATVNHDGTINLLGRGSVCINTGGEKVFHLRRGGGRR